MQGMTKRELKITDMDEIVKILDSAKVLHLGLSADNEPYVVPMNYGYIMEDGKLTLYLHSAVKGRKLEFINANPKVYFSLECGLQPFEGKVACQYTIRDQVFITRDHGRWYEQKGVWFMPTFHPSALLRDPAKKRDAWEDFQKVRDKLAELEAAPGRDG